MNEQSEAAPGKAHFVELQQSDLESVDAEHETSIRGKELMRRPHCRAANAVLQGVNIPVVCILRRISQTLQIYEFRYGKPCGSRARGGCREGKTHVSENGGYK